MLGSANIFEAYAQSSPDLTTILSADPVFQLMKDVMEDQNHEILKNYLRNMLNILLDLTIVVQYQQEVAQEILKISLQLLHNCLTESQTILHPSQ